jgi:hypothetical protein
MLRKQVPKETRRSEYLGGAKLLIAVVLFALVWSAPPARGQEPCSGLPSSVVLNANCFTVNECGDQTCKPNGSGGGSTIGTCELSDLDDPCVRHGCVGSTCTVGD